MNKSQISTITSSQLRRLQTSLLKRIQCQFMTCILSALFPCSCELNGRGPYYSEAGCEPIRSTELSTGSSALVSVHGRVPQQFSPYGQLNWNLQQLHFKSSSIAWTLSFRLTATFPPNWEQRAWFQFPYNDLNVPTTSAFSTIVWISLFDKVEHLTFDFVTLSRNLLPTLMSLYEVTILLLVVAKRLYSWRPIQRIDVSMRCGKDRLSHLFQLM